MIIPLIVIAVAGFVLYLGVRSLRQGKKRKAQARGSPPNYDFWRDVTAEYDDSDDFDDEEVNDHDEWNEKNHGGPL